MFSANEHSRKGLTFRRIPPKRPPWNCCAADLAAPYTSNRRNVTMSRVCELSGKGPMSGNTISHANNKSRRRFLPNLNDVTMMSDVLGQSFKLRVSAHALRTVDHRGGLDAFMAKAKDTELSDRALKIKRDIEKAQSAA